MRPLATLLSQQGHRCYVLEWPGWTSASLAEARCKLEELSGELEDFWCQALEHVALSEIEEAQAAPGTAEPAAAAAAAPRLCVIGAGHAAAYAVRALRRLQAFDTTPWSSKLEARGSMFPDVLEICASLWMFCGSCALPKACPENLELSPEPLCQ
ncbi:unnamed protein product [Prorocentrum cordatum]|uniref:Uncharacterized protein n=1 Tax=Prorocentrum cordatum TaxID=2364126 RepID=A0ABN9PNR8_9DINO|nr:unnamed protein product [Polarella glacialis]